MKAQQDNSLHLLAVRMDWLRWLARPVVLLWKGIVRLARWFWSLCVLAWRSLVVSFSYRYWFLAVIGGTIAFFFILYFYFLGIRINQPNLVLIGTILASLPLGWSMAEISSLIRRKAVTGEEFTISEIRYQLGAGFKAVRMLLKYVVLVVLLVAVQIGLGLIVHIPSVGPALFTLAMVPVIILSVFAFGCIVLLLFGLAVFPVHVLYTQPAAGLGFFRRQMAEAVFMLRFLRGNFFRLLFGMVPMSILSIPLFLIPVLVFGGSLGVTYLLTSEAMRLGSVFATIPARILAVLDMLTRGNWDVWGALSAIFVSVSMALLAGMLISLATAFFAGFFFNLYTRGIYLDGESGGGDRKEGAAMPAGGPSPGLLPLPEDLIEDEKLKLDDLDSGMDLLGGNTAAASGIGPGLGAAAGLGAGLAFSGSLPVLSGDADRSLQGMDDDEDISGDALLASIESTMPIAGGTSADGEDESLSLMDMDNPASFGDDISGDDLLASIESTMPIASDATSAVDDSGWSDTAADETLSIEDLTVPGEKAFDDDVSSEDILASIESTMPIADGADGDFSTTLEQENDQLARMEVDESLSDSGAADTSLSNEDDLSSLNNELDDLLGTADTDNPGGDDFDALLLEGEGGIPEGAGSDDLDGMFMPDAAPAGDDLSGLDGDLDALLAGSTPAAVPAGPDDELDALLGGEADTQSTGPADDLSGLDSELDALLGNADNGTDAPGAPSTDDIGMDAFSADEASPAGGDELSGLDNELDALLGGGDATGPAPDTDLDALLGGAGGGMDAPAATTAAAPDMDLDALLGGSTPTMAAAPAAAPEVVPFSSKGNIGGYGYLVSVKENNRVYFGIRGKSLPGPEQFTLNITYSGGMTGSEQVRIDSLDDKGMGYARLDLSAKLLEPGGGEVTGVTVAR